MIGTTSSEPITVALNKTLHTGSFTLDRQGVIRVSYKGRHRVRSLRDLASAPTAVTAVATQMMLSLVHETLEPWERQRL